MISIFSRHKCEENIVVMFDKLSRQPNPNCIHNYMTVQLDKRGSLPGSVVVVCACVCVLQCQIRKNKKSEFYGYQPLWVSVIGEGVIRRKDWTEGITKTVSFLTRSSDLFHSGTNGCDLETTAPQEQGKRLKTDSGRLVLWWLPAGSFDLFSGFL